MVPKSDRPARLAIRPPSGLAPITDPKELCTTLHAVLAGTDTNESHHAMSILVGLDGIDGAGIWPEVERQLEKDKGGHYWRLRHRLLIKYWPQHPRIRALVLKTIYHEEISLEALYEVYRSDPEIRPLLDATLGVCTKICVPTWCGRRSCWRDVA